MIRIKTFFSILFLMICTGYISAQKNIETGKKAPEIILARPDGNSFSLSSLKNRIVLIDFWATWCAPCMDEQPELKALYDQFSDQVKDKKFEIVGVSLDRNKESWEKAIHRFNINWIQVSDLKFWKSPVAKSYEVDELPFNVIIDGEGTILAINLHGKELEDFLKQNLSKK
ncbi:MULTISPECIES: TlpA disulfide reductase family protein [Chryseobacterium]|uniref:TlpA family protein disulfide reductase n=1 Tax=Chryseobacterium TaxID=59732 RepID=UPI001295352E|nr:MULTISPECIES: TlpA disulfide reductase family protein [Chryseobacterium]MDR6922633.1 thiol-disulfide isomerase/thioredoxin [Chryseobacterium sp. 2987]